MLTEEGNLFIVPTSTKLFMDEALWQSVQANARAVTPYLAQAKWIDAIYTVITAAQCAGVRFIRANGQPFDIPYIDEVFVDPRYVRSFVKHKKCTRPERDQFMYIYTQLRKEDQFAEAAKRFDKPLKKVKS